MAKTSGKSSMGGAGIVDEAIGLYRADGKPLPPATSGRDFANKMQNVAQQVAHSRRCAAGDGEVPIAHDHDSFIPSITLVVFATRWVSTARYTPGSGLPTQLAQQAGGGLQVVGVEAFGEPAIGAVEHAASVARAAALAPQA